MNKHSDKENSGQFEKNDPRITGNSFAEGHEPWNKGLTAEDDERILAGEDNPKTRTDITKERLERMYLEKKMTQAEIAEELDTTQAFISRKMDEFGIPTRSPRERHEVYGHPMEGREQSEETVERIKESMPDLSGENNPMYGRERPDASKQLKEWREEHPMTGEDNPNYGGLPEEHRRKALSSRKPTELEQRFIEVCENYDLPFKYVGDGKFWVENMNPDFIECNGKKIAIEILGEYWHSDEEFQERKEKFAEYGWECIGIWEHEIEKASDSELVSFLDGRINN